MRMLKYKGTNSNILAAVEVMNAAKQALSAVLEPLFRAVCVLALKRSWSRFKPLQKCTQGVEMTELGSQKIAPENLESLG